MTATTDGSTGAADLRAAPAGEPTDTTTAADDVLAAARRAAERSVEHLLGRQDEQGWWKGDLATNVTMDAEDLLLRQFLGIQDPATIEATARFIRGEQLGDGTWATFYEGPGDLSATIEAYVALRLAGDRPQDPHMVRAAGWVREQGGIAGARVFTRIWLALFGWWKWDDLPELPPELMFLPRGCRSTSTTSAAGRGRPSSRSPSSPPRGRSAPRPSPWTSCTRTRPARTRPSRWPLP
ncbi:hypothetical protein Sfulv_53430 [Streptomyces fulvorobeus]|uniref:Squalene cyclase N-terminal domain-containing protein n=1 Tax=Streptomyces fulvorobeus TaxID=284028 RepID=A0A7J0CDF3_9ACTN|nr:hypothetical protein Sfulv_53430 [Streptomyces fulvorobeus]